MDGFLLTILPLITAGGLIQLVMFLLNRRSGLKALDRTSGASLLMGANEAYAKLQITNDSLTSRIDTSDAARVKDNASFRVELDRIQADHAQERRGLVSQLQRANAELERLTTILVQRTTDLAIATRQIQDLQRRG